MNKKQRRMFAAQSDFRPFVAPEPDLARFRPTAGIHERFPFRPCAVGDDEGYMFHGFAEEDRALLSFAHISLDIKTARRLKRFADEEGFLPPETEMKLVRSTFALVEAPDGTLRKVDPEKVRFLDKGV